MQYVNDFIFALFEVFGVVCIDFGDLAIEIT